MRDRRAAVVTAVLAAAVLGGVIAVLVTLPFREPAASERHATRGRPAQTPFFAPSFSSERARPGRRLRARTTRARFVHGATKVLPARPRRREVEFEDNPKTLVSRTARVRRGRPTTAAARVRRTAGRGHGRRAEAFSAGAVGLFHNTDLGAGSAIRIAEPSVVANGPYVLQTWNSNAAVSSNGGTSFTFLNPASLFPRSYGGFCCDQLAYYLAGRDLYIWVLQYWADAADNNAIRIAVANGGPNLVGARFRYWDVTPQQIGDPSGTNYDQPKIARTTNYVYIEASRYTSGGGLGSIVLRIPIAQLAATGGLTYDVARPSRFSPALVQGAADTMFYAGHVDNATLRVYRWPESVGSAGVTYTDVRHSAYPTPGQNNCTRAGTASNTNWCARADDRINGGWLSGGVLGWAWSAGQGAGGLGTFPFPYVHALRVDAGALTRVDEPIVWSPAYAFQYPGITANSVGELGGMVMWGGGSTFQNCGVVFHGTGAGPFWELAAADGSDTDPTEAQGGDYSTARPDFANPRVWSAACYALKGGGASANVHPFYVSFGRPGTAPPPPPPPPPPPGPPPPPSDVQPPAFTAIVSKGRRGGRVQLSYAVTDNSGQTRERIRIFRGRALIATRTTPLGAVSSSYIYYVTWRAPRRRAAYRFCGQAFDPSGNASRISCARIRLR